MSTALSTLWARGKPRVLVLIVGSVLTLAVVALLVSVDLPLAVFVVLLLAAAATFRRDTMLGAVMLCAPFLPLARRVINEGSDGGPDPLSVLTFAIVGVVLTVSLRQLAQTRSVPRVFSLGALMILISVVLSIGFGGGASVEGIFSAVAVICCVLLAAGVGAEVLPDVWPFLERYLPVIGVLAGAYGLIQFFVLPRWDRYWMLHSELSSIGQALPMQVRIFGPSEAPGPFAFTLGLCVVIAASKALSPMSRGRLASGALAVFMLLPMLLSGVRTAVVGVVVSLAAILILRSRGVSKVLPLVAMAIILSLLSLLQSRLSTISSLFSANRYGSFDANTDKSFQDRLALIAILRSPGQYLIGRPSGLRYDNIVVDLMVNFGVLAAIGIAIGLAAITVSGLLNLRNGVNEVAAACTMFIVIAALSGNIFLSGFGLLAAAALGSTLRSRRSFLRAARVAANPTGSSRPLDLAPVDRE